MQVGGTNVFERSLFPHPCGRVSIRASRVRAGLSAATLEDAKQIWDSLGLPPLSPQAPWHGYTMGTWSEAWEEAAARTVTGDYAENGARTAKRRRSDVRPATPAEDLDRRSI
jgi:hypothetical protein